jgi:hypothetical protein
MHLNKLDNFYFSRPEALSVHSQLGIMFFDEDETFFKWKKLQQYLFDNYDIPEYDNGKFSFVAAGSPLYGVVDGVLMLIPFVNDDRIKPELTEKFKDVWSRLNSGSDNQIKGYSIQDLYDIFNLDKYRDYQCDYKSNGNIVTYKHTHTFYKQNAMHT